MSCRSRKLRRRRKRRRKNKRNGEGHGPRMGTNQHEQDPLDKSEDVVKEEYASPYKSL